MKRHSLIFVLAPLVALASSVIPHTLAQRALASDRVVIAEVTERKVVADPADPRRIKTHVQLSVRENVRGSGPDQVTIVQLGGTVGNTQYLVPGDATFAPGERALVFMHCVSSDRCYLVALRDGKLPIVDRDFVVVRDMMTDESTRRPLKEVVAELRALPPGKVRGPLAPENQGAAR